MDKVPAIARQTFDLGRGAELIYWLRVLPGVWVLLPRGIPLEQSR